MCLCLTWNWAELLAGSWQTSYVMFGRSVGGGGVAEGPGTLSRRALSRTNWLSVLHPTAGEDVLRGPGVKANPSATILTRTGRLVTSGMKKNILGRHVFGAILQYSCWFPETFLKKFYLTSFGGTNFT